MHKGMFLGLLAGLFLGSITSFATLAYRQGAWVADIAFMRSCLTLVVITLLSLVLGRGLRLDKGGMKYAAGICAIQIPMIFGYMGSVQFIAPGLAVAIFFTFPLQVLVMESIRTRTRPDLPTTAIFALALAGIIFSVGLDFEMHDPRGIALAVIGSLGSASNLAVVGAATRKGHGLPVLLPAQCVLIVVSLAAMEVFGGGLPELLLRPGLIHVFIAGTLAAVGLSCAYVGIHSAPPQWVALMMNSEPLMTLTIARLLLEERLDALQYAGILIAVSAIIAGNLWRLRAAKKAAGKSSAKSATMPQAQA